MEAIGHWSRRMGLRVRLTTLTAGAVGIAIALAAVAAYIVVSHQLHTQLDNTLRSSGTTVAARLHITPDGTISPGTLRDATYVAGTSNAVFEVVLDNGSVYYPTPPDPPTLPVTAEGRSWAAAAAQNEPFSQGASYPLNTISVKGVRYRVLSYPLGTLTDNFTGQPQGGAAVELAIPTRASVDHPLQVLRIVLIVVALCGIALAVGLGLLIAVTTIRPIVRLTRAAEHVASTQDLDASIEENGNDELARLAHAFNGMLGTLANSRRQQAQLVSDAGHELRTPLTSLRTNVEVLMRVEDLPAQDRAELLGDIRAQVEELTTLIGDVVELAREDERQPDPVEVRLDTVVNRAIERAERRAPSLDWEVSLTPGSVRAQPALLERAVLNVLDNATKWSPPGARVDVHLTRLDRWHLDVRDRGPGIATEDLPRVFDRFYRAPTARSMPGSGLGLAIVHQVVTSHGGTIAISAPPDGGTLVHIELPIVAESEPGEPDWTTPAQEAEVNGTYDGNGPTATNGNGNGTHDVIEPDWIIRSDTDDGDPPA